jgi:hypothetical protein
MVDGEPALGFLPADRTNTALARQKRIVVVGRHSVAARAIRALFREISDRSFVAP